MFGKIFAQMWQGSMVGKPDLQLVFVYLLANCDRGGVVDHHPSVIAALTGIAEDRVRAALSDLESADPQSRTPDLDGARLERLDDHRDWGWRIVNHAKYQELRSEEMRREQNRAAQQRRRDASARVSTRHQESAESANSRQQIADVDSASSNPTDSQKLPRSPAFGRLQGDDRCPELPTNRNGTRWRATSEQVEAWIEAFPGIDVPATLLEMRAWLVSNPTKRKTVSGMARFVNNWLSKEQNKP